ncbi:MAG: leucyl aminopeptidase [Phycisphaerales bacterium]|nr:leucyl aminopeptidase [Phycisphaerales bacterium]MCB9856567.1 leucyl aminopeptidase [Phycisphaerales bacterium]MCB9864636.1 leucyl aminopeptidase [Phycisphaerales bacterium]
MKIEMPTVDCKTLTPRIGADVLLIPVRVKKGKIAPPSLSGIDSRLKSRINELVERYHGSESVGAIESQVLPLSSKFGRAALVCITKEGDSGIAHVRNAAGLAYDWCRKTRVRRAAVWGESFDTAAEAAAWVEGYCLSGFRFVELREKKATDANAASANLTLLTSAKTLSATRKAATNAAKLAEAVNLARHLGHLPPNIVHPEALARMCQSIAKKYRLKCTVFDHKRMEREKFGAFLAVGMGSSSKPRMIILEHAGKGGAKSKPIVFVGKAVTLDTGGYSIKPAASIPDMKYDKQGGMAVVGALAACSLLGVKQRVIGVIGAAENMISGDAYRPGDIIRASNGRTIEVLNTDAEGRLVLADCLHYAEKTFKPSAMIDLATLTGACEVALGHECAGLMSRNDKLANALLASGEATDELLWRLPLWPIYREQIAGTDSDVKNIGSRAGGAITAATFLQEFVTDKTPWAHLDIAGTATTDKALPTSPIGATGFGVRLLMDYLGR